MSREVREQHKPHELGQTLMLLAQDFQRRLDSDLARRKVRGVSARHRAVFLHLGRHGPSRAVDLAQFAGVRPQSMMKIVHELEDAGLIQRRIDPQDLRAKRIDFTRRGRALIAQLSRSTETVWQHYATLLGEQVLQQTIENMNALLERGDGADA